MAELTEPVQTPGPAPVSTDGAGLSVPAQPWLFDEDVLPHRPDLVAKVKAYCHTGKIVDKDDELVEAICGAILLGQRARKIATHYGVSRNTVARIKGELETVGKLEPIKQRLSAKLGRLAEASIDDLIDRAEKGALPPNVLPIVMGVSVDKKGQLDAGVVPGTERHEAELDPEVIRAKWETMKRARVTEIQSVTKLEDSQ